MANPFLFARHVAREPVGKRIGSYIFIPACGAPLYLGHWLLDKYHWGPLRQEYEENEAAYRAKAKTYLENRRMMEQALTNEIGQLKRKRVSLLQEIENLRRNGGKNGT